MFLAEKVWDSYSRATNHGDAGLNVSSACSGSFSGSLDFDVVPDEGVLGLVPPPLLDFPIVAVLNYQSW